MTRWNFATTGNEIINAFGENLIGKTVVITGPGQGGIGAETAITIASAGPSLLILAGRTESKITPVVAEIARRYPNVAVRSVAIDLGSQRSVRSSAAEINGLVDRIDLLINNAGIMACPFSLTQDGIESQFATNYVGHFLLTNLLMGKILRSGVGARIVNVSSSAHSTSFRWNDVNFQDGNTYTPWEGYAQSKLAIIIFSHALTARLKSHKIASFSLHPGSIMSNLQVHMNAGPGGREGAIERARAKAREEGREFLEPKLKTMQQGCATTLVAALDPSLEPSSGAYLVDCDIAQIQPEVAQKDANLLWALTEKLVGEKFSI